MLDESPYVLIADDDPDALAMMVAACQIRGWRCEVAKTPKEIVDKVLEACSPEHPNITCFDALIVDVHYREQEEGQPRRTGVFAIREIRRQHFQNLPVIFVTAWDARMIRNETLEVGQEVIIKPFDPDYVLDRAEVWMVWSRRRKYEGQERRHFGMNRSHKYRRVSDIEPGKVTHTIIPGAVQPDPEHDKQMKKAM